MTEVQCFFSEKAVGNVTGCIGFVKDRNTKLNVPNTLLKEDIRDVTKKPMQKIYGVFSKSYTEDKFSKAEKLDKSIEFSSCHFSEEVEKVIDRDSI